MTRIIHSQRALIVCISLILVACGSTTPAFAQFNSGFTGVVVDQSQAAVPNAKIIVTNKATNVTQFVVSSDNGDFRVSSLAEGTYTVQVEAGGFKPWTQDVPLESNEVKTLYPSLALPTQTTSIQVTGQVAAVETDKSNTSRELSQQVIENAPLLGRNIYTSMIELAPGITGSGLPSGGALAAANRPCG